MVSVAARESLSVLPGLSPEVIEVFERAEDPTNIGQLRDLFLGQVEHRLGQKAVRPDLADRWRSSKRQRRTTEQELLRSRATARLTKEIFNTFFRDDLYGALRSEDHLILSSGSVDETRFGLPDALKRCVQYSLDRDWYGYSDSRGRDSTREAIVDLENQRLGRDAYRRDNVVVTLGGTAALSSLLEFVALRAEHRQRAVVAVPNYPPLVAAAARRFDVDLVPLPTGRSTHLAPLFDAVSADTSVLLLQTVTNPTGLPVDAAELDRLLDHVDPSTLVILDECHDCLGPQLHLGRNIDRPNVVRIKSLSKSYATPGMKLGWMVADEALVDDFYEHASSSYGSPASIFYLLLEIAARFELWQRQGVTVAGNAEVAQLEANYGVGADGLRLAYESFCRQRQERESALLALRERTVQRCATFCDGVIRPSHSLNVLVRPRARSQDYQLFRELLSDEGVALYPGCLAFCFDGGWLRISPGIGAAPLEEGLDRLERHVTKRRLRLLRSGS